MRLIDADALILAIRDYADKKCAHGETELANGILKTLSCINNAPTIELAKRGEWVIKIYIIDDEPVENTVCNSCYKQNQIAGLGNANFCPNCGADMRARP